MATSFNPFDIDSPDFNHDMYISKMLKEKHLAQLMESEQHLYREIQSLDSEMQTLVYENYNKFISATETIRKMSSKFDKMEEELLSLSEKMNLITESSERISGSLKTRHNDLTKLTGTHSVLQKLQFLFELAPKMQNCLDSGSYAEAVRNYFQAEKALEQYRHFPSIKVIDEDCAKLLAQLKDKLRAQLGNSTASHQDLSDSTKLLLQLNEPATRLAADYLEFSKRRLVVNLSELDYQSNLYRRNMDNEPGSDDTENAMDVLEFVDVSCSGFLTTLRQIIVAYEALFINRPESGGGKVDESDHEQLEKELERFVDSLINEFVDKIKKRVNLEKPTVQESSILVRALDRFYCRLIRVRKDYEKANFSRRALEIVMDSSKGQCAHCLQHLIARFNEELTKARTALAADGNSSSKCSNMFDVLMMLETGLSEQVKVTLASLMAFMQPEVAFVRDNSKFPQLFVRSVREEVIVAFLRNVLRTCSDFAAAGFATQTPSQLVLLLARLCLDLESSIIAYLLKFVDEQFAIRHEKSMTTASALANEAHQVAQQLINYYVRLEGHQISAMIRKSVETRDWLGSVEPRSVRSVVKRVVEDVSTLDILVGQLFEEGARTERSSDSSRSRRTLSALNRAAGFTQKTPGQPGTWSSYGASTIDNNLMSNIQKLFSEKIEIFAPVEFSKLSVITGIIKIGLKTLVECVRLCTFSKFGLQQIQVDAFYLQTHLWRFVSDENLVHSLLDEVLVSAVHRCLDPLLMEMSVVEKICEGL